MTNEQRVLVKFPKCSLTTKTFEGKAESMYVND